MVLQNSISVPTQSFDVELNLLMSSFVEKLSCLLEQAHTQPVFEVAPRDEAYDQAATSCLEQRVREFIPTSQKISLRPEDARLPTTAIISPCLICFTDTLFLQATHSLLDDLLR